MTIIMRCRGCVHTTMAWISNSFKDESVVETRSDYIVVEVVYCAKCRVSGETEE